MTTRIDTRFAALKKEGRKALVTFTTAGDPDYDTALALLKELPKAGADLVELGSGRSGACSDAKLELGATRYPTTMALRLVIAGGSIRHRSRCSALAR